MSVQLLELLHAADPVASEILAAEAARQDRTLELIASENHVSMPVMHAAGSWMTNKYAEGYPGRRYYGGCEHHDAIEQLAIDRACELFGCSFANVQPHCGANANTAAFMAMLKPGDYLLFGSESCGLPADVRTDIANRWGEAAFVTLPQVEGIRSLNLACAATAIVYQGLRQQSLGQ